MECLELSCCDILGCSHATSSSPSNGSSGRGFDRLHQLLESSQHLWLRGEFRHSQSVSLDILLGQSNSKYHVGNQHSIDDSLPVVALLKNERKHRETRTHSPLLFCCILILFLSLVLSFCSELKTKYVDWHTMISTLSPTIGHEAPGKRKHLHEEVIDTGQWTFCSDFLHLHISADSIAKREKHIYWRYTFLHWRSWCIVRRQGRRSDFFIVACFQICRSIETMLVVGDLATSICLLIILTIGSMGSVDTEHQTGRSRQEKTSVTDLDDLVKNLTTISTRSSSIASTPLSTLSPKNNLSIENLVDQFNSYRHIEILFRIRQCHSNMKLNDLCERYAIDNRTNLLIRVSLTPFRSLDHLSDMLIDRGIVQKLKKFCSPARWCLTDLSQDDVNLTTTFIEQHSRSLCSLEQCHQHLLTFTDTCPSLTNQVRCSSESRCLSLTFACRMWASRLWNYYRCSVPWTSIERIGSKVPAWRVLFMFCISSMLSGLNLK